MFTCELYNGHFKISIILCFMHFFACLECVSLETYVESILVRNVLIHLNLYIRFFCAINLNDNWKFF